MKFGETPFGGAVGGTVIDSQVRVQVLCSVRCAVFRTSLLVVSGPFFVMFGCMQAAGDMSYRFSDVRQESFWDVCLYARVIVLCTS